MLLYFYKGHLPWNNEMDDNIIIELKREIVKDTTYPMILLETLKYIRSLDFEEKPNYFLMIDNCKREIELLSSNN